MRTKITITAIGLAAILASIGILIVLMITLGPWPGLGAGVGIAATVLLTYRFVARPWHSRWGATDEEVNRSMPGDELVPAAASTTRATTVQATAGEVWPWLVQIGHGRASWYSYDWIDNDGRPSADRVLPEHQDLRVGDRILMAPDLCHRVLDRHQRSRGVHHGAEDAQGHQTPSRGGEMTVLARLNRERVLTHAHRSTGGDHGHHKGPT